MNLIWKKVDDAWKDNQMRHLQVNAEGTDWGAILTEMKVKCATVNQMS